MKNGQTKEYIDNNKEMCEISVFFQYDEHNLPLKRI